MGCDIHSFVEVRRNGRWEYVPWLSLPNPYFNPEEPESDDNPRFGFFIRRNYTLFAILVGVRDQWGMKFIAEPKYEIPPDVSEEVLSDYALRVVDSEPDDEKPECSRSDAERWISNNKSFWIEEGRLLTHPDWHSTSWYTLRELMAHAWQTIQVVQETVDAAGYQAFKAEKDYDIYGDSDEPLTNEEMEQRIAAGTTTKLCRSVIRWEETHANFARGFFTEGLPALFRLAVGSNNPEAFALALAVLDGDKTALAPLDDWLLEHGCLSLDDVRMVFWFDC